jgi:hypothetical protein
MACRVYLKPASRSKAIELPAAVTPQVDVGESFDVAFLTTPFLDQLIKEGKLVAVMLCLDQPLSRPELARLVAPWELRRLGEPLSRCSDGRLNGRLICAWSIAAMPMENRASRRQLVEIDGMIYDQHGQKLAHCILRNVSVGGAQLELDREAEIPERFLLALSHDGHVQRQCRKIWQFATVVGVKFNTRNL